MSVTHYLCIGCPLGCRLEVESDDDQIVEIRGFTCKKGKEFAEWEFHDPRRMVTTTVEVTGALWPRLPVKTTAPIPRDRVLELCTALREVRVAAPVRLGQVVLADALGTGVDVVATRAMPAVLAAPEL
jgi:CxxC motif-containing protein